MGHYFLDRRYDFTNMRNVYLNEETFFLVKNKLQKKYFYLSGPALTPPLLRRKKNIAASITYTADLKQDKVTKYYSCIA